MKTGLIEYTAKRLKRVLIAPIQTLFRKIKRMLSPESFASQVVGDVRKGIGSKAGKKERSLKDYFSFGHYYVLKKLVYLFLVALVVIPILYVKLLHPIIISQFFTKTMTVDSEEMIGYSGKVRLLAEEDGTLLFEGRMEDGRINGKGQLYNYAGALLYDGNFEMEAYSGEGEL